MDFKSLFGYCNSKTQCNELQGLFSTHKELWNEKSNLIFQKVQIRSSRSKKKEERLVALTERIELTVTKIKEIEENLLLHINKDIELQPLVQEIVKAKDTKDFFLTFKELTPWSRNEGLMLALVLETSLKEYPTELTKLVTFATDGRRFSSCLGLCEKLYSTVEEELPKIKEKLSRIKGHDVNLVISSDFIYLT